MSGPQRHDSTGELFSLSRDELIKRVLALTRDNERLQGEIKRSTEEVADLQFQLLRHQTAAAAAGTKTQRGNKTGNNRRPLQLAATGRKDQGDEDTLHQMEAEEAAVEVEEQARQEAPPSTPPDAVRSSDKKYSSLLLESPGWGSSVCDLVSMADALEKDFILRSAQQQQQQQPQPKEKGPSQGASTALASAASSPGITATLLSPLSLGSPATGIGRKRLSLRKRTNESATPSQVPHEAERERERKAKEQEEKEQKEREQREKEQEESERREREQRAREKSAREQKEREQMAKENERKRKEREQKEREEREKREQREKERKERELKAKEKREKEQKERKRKAKEQEEREREERERKAKDQEEREQRAKEEERKKREKEERERKENEQKEREQKAKEQNEAREWIERKEKEKSPGKRAIVDTRNEAPGQPVTPTPAEDRSPTKKQKVAEQQEEGGLYLDGINLLRAEQADDGRGSAFQPAKRPKSLKKQLEEERLQRDYRSIRSFFSLNAKKPADTGSASSSSPQISYSEPPAPTITAADTPASTPKAGPAAVPPAPSVANLEAEPHAEAADDKERKKLARARVKAAVDQKKMPRFVFGENCPGCATWMSKSDINTGMEACAPAGADASPHTRCAKCAHSFAPTVEVTFSMSRQRKEEDRKERVHFFDKAHLEALAKQRYKQGGRKSFASTLLAEERMDLYWNLIYHFGSLKDAVCTIFPTLNWNAVFRPCPKA